MWGSTTPNTADECNWPNAPFNNGSSSFDSSYFNSVKNTVCPNDVLAKEYDAAAQIMGGDWRMPTHTEIQELVDNTTNEWTQVNGVNGRKFTSKTDTSKYIFIPAAGDYNDGRENSVGGHGYVWSSSLLTWSHGYACFLHFKSDNCYAGTYGFYRFIGHSVRGVL